MTNIGRFLGSACTCLLVACSASPEGVESEADGTSQAELTVSGDKLLAKVTSCRVLYGPQFTRDGNAQIVGRRDFGGGDGSLTLAVEFFGKWYSIWLTQQRPIYSVRKTGTRVFRFPDKASALAQDYTGATYDGGENLSTGGQADGTIIVSAGTQSDINSRWGDGVLFTVTCR